LLPTIKKRQGGKVSILYKFTLLPRRTFPRKRMIRSEFLFYYVIIIIIIHCAALQTLINLIKIYDSTRVTFIFTASTYHSSRHLSRARFYLISCFYYCRVICGLTAFTTKNHIIRAALETVCYQVGDIIDAMKKDADIHLKRLHVDGKMANNSLLMQLQADISGVPILRSMSEDTTSLGCAIAAAYAIDLVDLRPENRVYSVRVHHDTYLPTSTHEDRRAKIKKWKMAVERSYGWSKQTKSQTMTDERYSMLSSIPLTLFLTSSFLLLAASEICK
jgi:glycerol kinase